MLLRLRKQNSLRVSWQKNPHKVMYKECKERVAVGGRNIQRQQGKKSELSSKEGCDK